MSSPVHSKGNRSYRSYRSYLTYFVALLCALLAWPALAADPAVSAGFTRQVGEVGVPLQFQLRVNGSDTATAPPEISVDGLSFSYIGPQSQQLWSFGTGRGASSSISVIHVYQCTPQRAGNFTVPPLTVTIDGREYRSQPVGLRVQDAPAGSTGPEAVIQAEIALSKETAYLGESIPVELRLLFDAQTRADLEKMPTFEGDGFTKLKLTQPKRTRMQRGARDYVALVFRTVITPIRAGKVKVGPSKTQVAVQIPRPQSRGSRFPFDAFTDPFGAFGRMQERELTAEAAELIVKPLPTAGRPKSFSGAVGQFQLSGQGAPARVKINDPVTMTLTVSGSGNFERVSAPVLTDPAGWRAYDPSEKFTPSDETGTQGTKSFEIAVIPEAKKTQMPVFEFAYFDPTAEKYVALKSKPAPLVVEGEPPPPPPAPVATRSSDASSAPAPKAAPAPPAPADILSIRYDFGAARSLRPLYKEPLFLGAQVVPLLVLLGLLGARFRRPKSDAGRQARLRRQRSEMLSRLRRAEDRPTFYETAARVLQLDAALVTGRDPETIDAATVRRLAGGNGETSVVLDEIFETRAEALYAGTASGGASVSPIERERVLGAVKSLSKGAA